MALTCKWVKDPADALVMKWRADEATTRHKESRSTRNERAEIK